MAKMEADYLKKVEIYWLKKKECLKGFCNSTLSWTNKFSGDESSIGIMVSTWDEDKYIRFQYTQTDYNGNKTEFDYKVKLTTTACNYGGERYWFICPLAKNGVPCGRRVGVLYKGGNYFGCRHCYELTYESRKISGFQKPFGKIISIPELEKLKDEVKRTHYNGKMTKKYKRFLEKDRKASIAMRAVVMALGRRSGLG